MNAPVGSDPSTPRGRAGQWSGRRLAVLVAGFAAPFLTSGEREGGKRMFRGLARVAAAAAACAEVEVVGEGGRGR